MKLSKRIQMRKILAIAALGVTRVLWRDSLHHPSPDTATTADDIPATAADDTNGPNPKKWPRTSRISQVGAARLPH
jgi:hypothetical protein